MNVYSVLTEVTPPIFGRCFLFQGLDADPPHRRRPLLMGFERHFSLNDRYTVRHQISKKAAVGLDEVPGAFGDAAYAVLKDFVHEGGVPGPEPVAVKGRPVRCLVSRHAIDVGGDPPLIGLAAVVVRRPRDEVLDGGHIAGTGRAVPEEEPRVWVRELCCGVLPGWINGFWVLEALGELDVREQGRCPGAAGDGVLSLLYGPVEVGALGPCFLTGPLDFAVGCGGTGDHAEPWGWLDGVAGLVGMGLVVDLDPARDAGVACGVEHCRYPVSGAVAFEPVAC